MIELIGQNIEKYKVHACQLSQYFTIVPPEVQILPVLFQFMLASIVPPEVRLPVLFPRKYACQYCSPRSTKFMLASIVPPEVRLPVLFPQKYKVHACQLSQYLISCSLLTLPTHPPTVAGLPAPRFSLIPSINL